MNLQQLKTLIDSEPLNAARSDADVLAWLNETQTVQGDVSWTDYMLWLSETSGVVKLRTAAASGSADAIKNAGELALIVAQSGQPLFVSRADVRASLAPLISGGVFSAGERDSLLAKGALTPTRWEVAGLPIGNLGDVIHARAA